MTMTSPRITEEIVTPEIAVEWLKQNTGNRSLRPQIVNTYVRDMKAGDWYYTGDPIKFDRDGVLLDGQHRLEAVVTSGETITFAVIRDLEPTTRSFVDQGVKRTATDALGWAGVEKNRSAIAGAARIGRGIERGRIRTALSGPSPALSHADIIDWVTENPDVIDAAVHGTTLRIPGTTPSALTYAVLTTSRLDPDQMIVFFDSVKEFRTDGPEDPRAALIRTLQGAALERRGMRPPLQLYYIFRAWNAWRSGEALQHMKAVRTVDGKTIGYNIPEPK